MTTMPRTATRTPTSPRGRVPDPGPARPRRAGALGLVLGAILLSGVASHVMGQVSLDQPPLDEHDAKRVDRLEKAMKELRAIVFQGRETGAPVVIQPADTDGQLGRLTDRLNDIDQTLAHLNGELEVIRHDLDQSHRDLEQTRGANAELRERLDTLERSVKALTPPPPPPPEAATAPATPAAPDPAAMFAEARTALEQGDMHTAEAGLRAFLDTSGDGPRGPEARYYLARTLMARKDWPDAATADIGAIRGWPHTTWAPAAVLDLSRALLAMSKTDDACGILGELATHYPKAPPTLLKDALRLRAQAKCG
jgi:TolA-binding protein